MLLVTPAKPVTADPEHSQEMWAFRCAGARVDVVDNEPPISAEAAAAGWKQPI